MDDKELIEELRDAAETCISEGNFIWADFMKSAADRLQELTQREIPDWSEVQKWEGMDGSIAFHLIDRHADGWGDTGDMMNAWLAANTPKLEPLTDEQIDAEHDKRFPAIAIPGERAKVRAFARAIEAARGIKGE